MDGVSKLPEEEGVLINDVNPAVHLVIEKEKRALGPELLAQVWEELFSKTRRLNTSFYGTALTALIWRIRGSNGS